MADRQSHRLVGEHSGTLSSEGAGFISQNRAKNRAHIGLIFIRWTETRLQINANVKII